METAFMLRLKVALGEKQSHLFASETLKLFLQQVFAELSDNKTINVLQNVNDQCLTFCLQCLHGLTLPHYCSGAMGHN